MELENKYSLPTEVIGKLTVVELLDFVDFPLLTVESTISGKLFLNYFERFRDNFEERYLIEISEARLKLIRSGELSVKDAFNRAENQIVFICYFDNTSKLIELYFQPCDLFSSLNPITDNYKINNEPNRNDLPLNELLILSKQRDKLVLGFYLTAKSLQSSLKYWAIKNFLTPLYEMLLQSLGINLKNRKDRDLFNQLNVGITDLALSSLRGNLELNNISNLFGDNFQTIRLSKIFDLFNSTDKATLIKSLDDVNNKKILHKYINILNSVSKNDAILLTSLATPKEETFSTRIDKAKANQIKKIINEEYPIVEDIEEIEGQFLELDMSIKQPTFAMSALNEDFIYKGKLTSELLVKIPLKDINFKGKEYLFTVKTLYRQETSTSPEKNEHFLLDFQELTP